MIRFGFYTDTHLSGKTPKHRLDDFPATMTEKLKEVYATAEDAGCEFMAFGGDFFNTHRVFAYDVIGDAMDVICDSKLKTYCCVGEHDLYGHSPNTYKSSTLAFFVRRCPNMQILWEPLDMGDIVLHAKHEWEDMHESFKRDVDQSKLNVLICHELITNKRAMFTVINTSELPPNPFDIVVSGDLHDGYEPHEVDGSWFCNPGSLARRTTADTRRFPQMAIIDIEKGGIPIIDVRRLACGKPGDDILGKSIAEVAREKGDDEEFNADEFTEGMMKLEAESVDVHELIQKTAKKAGVSKEVIDYLASKKK